MKKTALTNLAGQEISTKVLRARPLGAQVLILPAPKKEKTASGIIIEGMDQRLNYGQVMSVGPGDEFNPPHTMAAVQKGDTVLYGEDSGEDVQVNGQWLKTMRISDIKLVLEEIDAETAKKEAMPAGKVLLHPDTPAISNEAAKVHGQPAPQRK